MANRIDALYRLLSEIKNKGPIIAAKISKVLMKWIDSHIPLCIYMELTGKYKDEEVLNDVVYKLIKPHDSLAFDINSLPNCAVHCLYSKIWGDSNRDDSPFDSVIDSGIIDILSKSIPSACKLRGVSRKILLKIQTDPLINKSNDLINDFFTISTSQVLLDVIIRIITASMLGMFFFTEYTSAKERSIDTLLLGIYEHANVVASFFRRKCIYYWFMWSDINNNALCQWINDYKGLDSFSKKTLIHFFFLNIGKMSLMSSFLMTLVDRHYSVHYQRILFLYDRKECPGITHLHGHNISMESHETKR